MNLPSYAVDYRNFRLNKINTPEYRHLWLLLIWPGFILRYFLVEKLNPAAVYTVIHCPLDDRIPFCEGFVIFYVLWFVAIFGMHLYTLVYDLDVFKRYSKFLIFSLSISSVIFLVFPSCQELRPETFPRDNLLTKIVGLLYAVDTNTNVLPSEHAIGAIAVFSAGIHCRRLQTPGKIAALLVMAVLISLSTVFLKQHSVLDVLAAVPICAAAYWLCFGRREKE